MKEQEKTKKDHKEIKIDPQLTPPTTKRVFRVAPSPTGQLHLGHAKTYILNFLLAKKYNGDLIFRVDDTDIKRNQLEFLSKMIKDILWLGIRFDYGPDFDSSTFEVKKNQYFQSERLEIYQRYIDELLKSKNAFKAYETDEERKQQIEQARKNKQLPIYNGGHENLTKEEEQKYINEGRKPVIRLKVDLNKKIKFKDGVFGQIEVNTNSFGSFTIMKSNGYPMYNFASIIDDLEMGVTDVIRGKEHITNTHKQIAILEKLGKNPPRFAHYPLILNETGPGKLSKRNGAKSLSKYRAEGYLSEALINYLVLISCSFHFTDKNQEVMSLEEIIEVFEISKLLKTNSRFSSAKLDWLNGQHIRKLSDKVYFDRIYHWLENEASELVDFIDEETSKNDLRDLIIAFKDNFEKLKSSLLLVKERISKFSDIFEQLKFMIKARSPKEIDFFQSNLDLENQIKISTLILDLHKNLKFPLKQEEWEASMRKIAEENNLKAGDVFMLLRLLIVGERFSPPLIDSMNQLGENVCVNRIVEGVEYIKSQDYNKLEN